jgi:ribonuclease BN (tRNA processing enzyme)
VSAGSIQLNVAGAGPAYSDKAGALGSAYVVRSTRGGRPLVLDLGQGTFPNVFAAARPADLAAVLISHLHPDHFVDLVPLRHYLRWELDGRVAVPILAPAGLDGRLDAVSGEPGFGSGVLAVAPLAPGPLPIPTTDLRVEAARVTHRGESFAFRVAVAVAGADGGIAGPGLVYSGDCGRASDLEPLIRAGDTLLTEVSFGTGPSPVPDLHLDATAVGDLATRCRVGRVLLTHLQIGYGAQATIDAVRSRFDGPVALVAPGDALEVAGA